MHKDDQTPDDPRAPTEPARTPETTPAAGAEPAAQPSAESDAPELRAADEATPEDAPVDDLGEDDLEADLADEDDLGAEDDLDDEDDPEAVTAEAGDGPQAASPKPRGPAPGEGDRIAKVLSRRGVASRRDAERLVLEGRVEVNGKTVTTPATNVTDKDRITVDGDAIGMPEDTRLWLYHKPAGLVTTEHDEEGRPTVFDDLPEDMPRVMSVGRLDLTSEGLLLLTNDGEVKRRLELPSTGWSRRYRVRINGRPTEEDLEPLRQGITVDGEDFQPMDVSIDRQQGANAWLTMTLREGKNREIRRAMEHLGFTVNRLIRISFGPFQLGDLPVGDVEEVRPKIVRDQLGQAKATPVTRARKARKPDEDMPAAGGEPADRPERERLATSRPEGASVRRELKPRGPKARPEGRDDGAPRGRGFRDKPVTTKDLFAKPRTYMRVDEDRARAAARAEAEAQEAETPSRGDDRPRRDAGDRPRSSGYKSHGGPRQGGDERPRAAGFRSHRAEGDRPARSFNRDEDRPRRPREDGDRPARPPREEGDRKPRWSSGDRSERPARDGDRPYKPREEGDRPARPYKPRAEGDRPARAYKPREDGDRPARPYKPRTEGDRPSRPYKPREEGDRPARAYKPREEGDRGPRRGFEPSRPGADRPARPYKPREEGDRPSRPYKPREEGDRPARAFKPRAPRDGDAPRSFGGPRSDRPARSGGPAGPRKGPPSGPRGPKPRRG